MGILTNIPSENVRVDVTVSLNTLYKKKESMRATMLCSAMLCRYWMRKREQRTRKGVDKMSNKANRMRTRGIMHNTKNSRYDKRGDRAIEGEQRGQEREQLG